MKLVRTEPETQALRSHLKRHPLRVTSTIAVVEVRRAALGEGSAAEREKADEVLRSIVLIRLTSEILERAATLPPPGLRSLDAIHLATALSLISEQAVEIAEFVVYDRRLGEAARASGLTVVGPGSSS